MFKSTLFAVAGLFGVIGYQADWQVETIPSTLERGENIKIVEVEKVIVLETRDVQLNCMAMALDGEARGEDDEGQIRVGEVILNRVDSPRYPNTICDVVFQPRQFSFANDYDVNYMKTAAVFSGMDRDKEAQERVSRAYVNAAKVMVAKERLLGRDVLHYCTKKSKNMWRDDNKIELNHGNHNFYRGIL